MTTHLMAHRTELRICREFMEKIELYLQQEQVNLDWVQLIFMVWKDVGTIMSSSWMLISAIM